MVTLGQIQILSNILHRKSEDVTVNDEVYFKFYKTYFKKFLSGHYSLLQSFKILLEFHEFWSLSQNRLPVK